MKTEPLNKAKEFMLDKLSLDKLKSFLANKKDVSQEQFIQFLVDEKIEMAALFKYHKKEIRKLTETMYHHPDLLEWLESNGFNLLHKTPSGETLLTTFAKNDKEGKGFQKLLKLLLVNPEFKKQDNYCFWDATEHNMINNMKTCLKSGFPVYPQAVRMQWKRAFHYIHQSQDPELMELAKTVFNIKDRFYKEVPDALSILKGSLVDNFNEEFLDTLKKLGVDFKFADGFGKTLAMVLMEIGVLPADKMINMLEKMDIDLTTTNKFGQNMVHFYAMHTSHQSTPESIKEFLVWLKEKVGLEVPDHHGTLPLHIAINSSISTKLGVLLELGCKADKIMPIEDDYVYPFIHYFSMDKISLFETGPDFTTNEMTEQLQKNMKLFIQGGGDINGYQKDRNETVLMHCLEKHHDLIKTALELGANPYLKNENGEVMLELPPYFHHNKEEYKKGLSILETLLLQDDMKNKLITLPQNSKPKLVL